MTGNKINFKFKKSGEGQQGFTLVELLITVFIFSIISIIIGGIFVQVLNIQKRASAVQEIQENMNFVLELMAREIRVSKVCPITGQCSSSSVLDMEHPVNGDINYNLQGGQIHRVVNGIDTTMSSSRVEFTNLGFYVSGDDNNDGFQPRVTIVISAKSLDFDSLPEIVAQTTVSQRWLSDKYKQ